MSNQLSHPGSPIECSHFKEMALSSEKTPLGGGRVIFQRGSANIYNFKLSKVTALRGCYRDLSSYHQVWAGTNSKFL